MKQQVLLAAVAAPVLLAFTLPKTKLSFAPAEGTSLTKVFTNETELTLEDMSMSMNGEEMPFQMEMDMTVTSVASTTVTDEYVSMRDGAPGKLKRTYDGLEATTSMSMEMDMMGESQSMDSDADASSDLEGKTVVFAWSDDESEFKASFPEDTEGDEELLENLAENMDLRDLLPSGDVSEGDEWEIDVKALDSVLAPGGDMKLVPEEMDDEMKSMMGPMGSDGMGSLQDWVSDEIEGTATGKFTGMRDVDGTSMAVITINIDINTAVDLTDLVAESMEDADMPMEIEMEIDHLDLEFELEAEGTLLWNVKGGHFHSLELSGETNLLVDTGMAMNAGGEEMTIENSVEMSGTMTLGATIE